MLTQQHFSFAVLYRVFIHRCQMCNPYPRCLKWSVIIEDKLFNNMSLTKQFSFLELGSCEKLMQSIFSPPIYLFLTACLRLGLLVESCPCFPVPPLVSKANMYINT